MTSATEVLAEALEMTPGDIGQEAAMENMDRWDSLAHIRLVSLVEKKIGRALATEEMLSITSLGNLQTILDKG